MLCQGKMIHLSKKTDIKELSTDQLTLWLQNRGFRPFHTGQIFKWIYLHQADAFEIMTDLAKELRRLLSAHFTINRLEKKQVETSKDGTRKYLFKLADGKHVESVIIPERDHDTLCISSQVGCAQGCRFCLTGQYGLTRDLTKGEIVSQVRDITKEMNDSTRLTNIVLMGMGEPLANYQNVVRALETITDSDFGLKFSNRRVTLSTAGLVSKLSDLSRDTRVNLAVSLNATENKTRDRLMPINRRFPVEELMAACKRYRLHAGRRITFEYILIQGVNDSVEDAKRLCKLIRPIKAKINLIPLNEHKSCEFRRPSNFVIERFHDILHQNNYTVIIRQSKGQDISAACGQLSAHPTSHRIKSDIA